MKHTYAAAGVSFKTADNIKSLIKQHVKDTHNPEVLAGPGLFGGLFELKGFNRPVLVSSVDGVGTKLKIAEAMDKYDTVGIDIVNHCVNDIFTCGAEPLFFLDYIAMGRLVPHKIEAIVNGLSVACQEVGCALIGGETAELPGIYATDDYDLAGFIVGVIEKDNIIDGSTISAGDTILGVPSNGLHTNGYSLVRKIFGETVSALNTHYPELGKTLGETLLEPHRSYYRMLKPFLPDIKGMAHITGGGLIGNVPRILPEGLSARFNSESWSILPIFNLIHYMGKVNLKEMYRVFNMGIGMVLICSFDKVERLSKRIPEARIIGEIINQTGKARVVIK